MSTDLDQRLREILRATVPAATGLSDDAIEQDVRHRVARRRTRRRIAGVVAGLATVGLFSAGALILGPNDNPTVQTRPADTTGVSPADESPETTQATGVTVPDVVGMREAAARQTLEAVGVVVTVVNDPTTDPRSIGKVVSQDPAGNTTAPSGSVVTIVVAILGTSGNQSAVIPDVNGLHEAAAKQAVSDAGFVPSVIYQGAPNPDAVVVSQNPAVGATAPPGTTVTLVLALPEG
jgi:hypothetical protein